MIGLIVVCVPELGIFITLFNIRYSCYEWIRVAGWQCLSWTVCDITDITLSDVGAVGGRPDILSDRLSSRTAYASTSDITHNGNQLSMSYNCDLRKSLSSITAVATVEVPPKLLGDVESTAVGDAVVQRKSTGSEMCEDIQSTVLVLTNDNIARNTMWVSVRLLLIFFWLPFRACYLAVAVVNVFYCPRRFNPMVVESEQLLSVSK